MLPNVVNLLAVNGRVVAPEPFYSRFKDEFVVRLSTLGYQQGASLRFIDDWDVYHDKKGDVHCGTGVKRAPTDVRWWTQNAESSRAVKIDGGDMP